MAKIEVPDSTFETAILRFLERRRRQRAPETATLTLRTEATAKHVYVEWTAYDANGAREAGGTDAYSWPLALRLFAASADGEEDPCGEA